MLRNATFAAQDAELDRLHEFYRPYRVAMDQTGMGEKPVEDAKRRYGDLAVDGVLLVAPRQLVLATTFKQRLEDRKMRLPAGDRELRADLHGPKRETGPTGTPRLLTAEDGDSSHCDRFWAGALAAGAAAGGRWMAGYRPVAGQQPADERRLTMRPNHAGDGRRDRGPWSRHSGMGAIP